MLSRKTSTAVIAVASMAGCMALLARSEERRQVPQAAAPADAIVAAQVSNAVPVTRPEQALSDHDRSDIFAATKAQPSSPAFDFQPERGQIQGFDFYRDPLNSSRPMMTFEEIYAADVAAKPAVMATCGSRCRGYDSDAADRSSGQDVPRQAGADRPHGPASPRA